MAFVLCMHPQTSCLFLSDSVGTTSQIHQLTIHGESLRSIKLSPCPFLRVSSMAFDPFVDRLIIADSLNSIVYSLRSEFDDNDDDVQILFERSDHLYCPQALCLTDEGQLAVVESSLSTEHALKIFRLHCRSSRSVNSTLATFKTSEQRSVRSIIARYELDKNEQVALLQ